MKDYSEWSPVLDYEYESDFLESHDRPWLLYRPSYIPKSIKFESIPLHEFIKTTANKIPNNVCVYHKPTDKKYTYRELNYISDKVANALFQIGIRKGDAVGVMTPNCPEFLFSCVGILETGAAVTPINPLLKESDVEHIIREAGNIKTVFVHKSNYRTMKKVNKKFDLDNIILIGTKQDRDNNILFEELIEDVFPSPPDININPMEDLAAILFTGGTTGLPKGVMLTHNNIVADALLTLHTNRNSEEPIEDNFGNTVNLSILPLCHTFGFEIMVSALYGGAMLVMFASFNPSEVLEALEYYEVSIFVGVPVMYQMLIHSHDFTEKDLSNMEQANSGSAALAPELARKWEKIVGIKVGQGFGLTESSPITHIPAPWMPEVKSESIGIPLINTDAKIVNPETLEEVPTGYTGELMIKGPQVMKGYWNKPKLTENTIIDGWLKTGDLARMDEQGYFYIEGRTKDIIKYKGYKVMPKEVEEKLFEHPAILEAGVVSAPDPNIGETIKAYVVLKSKYRDSKITERDIIEWSKERLAGYKYPRKVEFLKALPRTMVGKTFRRKLREMATNK
ncbi:MAG: Long-chain-fatty-acid--CoA ligase (modular protein) [Promethearchaeota archaeon]|nr:MAG: Long-chain-fatty-acid--CoA ligase (modular protein) [Candidatus Lokiarchaeota archaeon]